MASKPGSGPKKPLPSPVEGFGEVDEAAVADYSKQLGSIDLDALDDAEDPLEIARKSAGKSAGAGGSGDRPNLEPVGDDAHPPQNRRIPTQPPSALMLDLDDDDRPARPSASERRSSEAAAARGEPARPDRPPQTPPLSQPKLGPRQSPAPVRRGLFSSDRVTNLLAGAAVGLLLTIYPAKKIARSYEVREVEPMLADLEGAIEHPLGVEAGLVERPEALAAKIHEGRSKVRRRYMAIWLLVGLPIGLGVGFAPRPGD